MITNPQNPPYYAVIFTSILDRQDPQYYSINDMLEQQAEKLENLFLKFANTSQEGSFIEKSYKIKILKWSVFSPKKAKKPFRSSE